MGATLPCKFVAILDRYDVCDAFEGNTLPRILIGEVNNGYKLGKPEAGKPVNKPGRALLVKSISEKSVRTDAEMVGEDFSGQLQNLRGDKVTIQLKRYCHH